MLQMLCQVLQTDDVGAVQAWLMSAPDRGLNGDVAKCEANNDQEILSDPFILYMSFTFGRVLLVLTLVNKIITTMVIRPLDDRIYCV